MAEAEAGLATAEEIENYSAVTVAHAVVALIALHRNDLAATDAYLRRGAAQSRPTGRGTGWIGSVGARPSCKRLEVIAQAHSTTSMAPGRAAPVPACGPRSPSRP